MSERERFQDLVRDYTHAAIDVHEARLLRTAQMDDAKARMTDAYLALMDAYDSLARRVQP